VVPSAAPSNEADVVVDLGCGSGEFTALLASLVPRGHVTGIDQDESMLEEARRHEGPNLGFVKSPAQLLDEVLEPASVDLVVSRAMLHWLPLEVYPRLFKGVYNVLRPGGWFHAEGGGAGNVPRMSMLLNDIAARHGLPPVPPFPDTGLVFEMIEEAGFEVLPEGVRTVAQRRAFTRKQAVGLLRT
jgi:trans-aconitate methyltransferase